MVFRITRQSAPRVEPPPDRILIGSTEGHGTWNLSEDEAYQLADALILQLPDLQLCTMNGEEPGSQCCCKNCPWGNEHQYPRSGHLGVE